MAKPTPETDHTVAPMPADTCDAITWDRIADPRAFLALCHGMKG